MFPNSSVCFNLSVTLTLTTDQTLLFGQQEVRGKLITISS